jgi:hypothetical protein
MEAFACIVVLVISVFLESAFVTSKRQSVTAYRKVYKNIASTHFQAVMGQHFLSFDR